MESIKFLIDSVLCKQKNTDVSYICNFGNFLNSVLVVTMFSLMILSLVFGIRDLNNPMNLHDKPCNYPKTDENFVHIGSVYLIIYGINEIAMGLSFIFIMITTRFNFMILSFFIGMLFGVTMVLSLTLTAVSTSLLIVGYTACVNYVSTMILFSVVMTSILRICYVVKQIV